jgi:general secretion pathway protein D
MKPPTIFYKQAYDLKPKDLRYRSGFERMRSKAAMTIVHQGVHITSRTGQVGGGAGVEFQKAAQIDPSLFSAQQELKRTLQMINDKPAILRRRPLDLPAIWKKRSGKRAVP